MSLPLRPASESYQAACCSVSDSLSNSSQDGINISTSEDDDSPIFSISKSSMDVVMAAGPPHLRDPTFTRLADLRRSSSTSDQNSCIHQLNPCQNSSNHLLSKQNLDLHNRPPSQALSERWISNMQRWSGCSMQSRSSTPDTVIFKGSRPSSLIQEKLPDSPKLSSPPRTPSPLISPLHTPTTPLQNASTPQSPLNQQEDVLLVANSLIFSPLQAKIISPLPPKELLCFTFPSPVSSSVSLEKVASKDRLFYNVQSYSIETSLEESLTDTLPENVSQEFDRQDRICDLEFTNFAPSWRPPLVSSFSDSYIAECSCRCNDNFCKDLKSLAKNQNIEEGTMTSHIELVDVGVQTLSPIGSWWNLRRNIPDVGSPSILGSPPGSRLNLRLQIGSHSNLVSPSSSMFPVHSDKECSKVEKDDLAWETSSNVGLERRRSCLKIYSENRSRDERRSSMKQVQWDEDGMTWDVHGASIDPEELNMAIQKHLELKCNEEMQKSPKIVRKSSKKKRAPKPPVNLKAPVIMVEGKDDFGDSDMMEVMEVGDTVVYGDGVRRKSASPGSVQSRKRSVIRSFTKPGWCGASRKQED